MKEDIVQIKSSNDIFIFAAKTNNLYNSSPEEYKNLLFNNITKSYLKSTKRLKKAINLEAKHISEKLELDNRIECLAKSTAFISLKDHKPNFQSSLSCRLINPSKINIGKISKSILDKVNQNLRNKLRFNQWKNSENVTDWFKKIENKSKHVFIKFDIAEIYPSISEYILRTAIRFAEDHVEFTDEEKRIIFHCRKSLLFYKNEPWKKKDGDDGLMIQEYINGQQIDQLRKKIIKIFKETGFKTDIETNLKIVNFLDMTFNLINDSYKPYKKPNETLLYINKNSNHPPQIIKKVPK